jgi:hypothetical protein
MAEKRTKADERWASMRWFAFLLVLFLLATGAYCVAKDADNGSSKASTSVSSYLSEIAKKCGKYYFPPAYVSNAAGEVACELQSSGSVKDIKVIVGPLYKRTKQRDVLAYSALKEAVTKAAPFPKPPTEIPCPVRLLVTFNKIGDAKAKLYATSHALSGK